MKLDFQKELDGYISSQGSRLKSVSVSQGANLFSPLTIEIKKSDYDLVEASIRGFFLARQNLSPNNSHHNYSVLMSYDFHFTESGPKLIEINTNAGQSLYAHFLYEFKGEPTSYLKKPFADSLRESFQNEARLTGVSEKPTAVITDENLEKQFFYPEFSLFADQMEIWGWRPYVCDASALNWQDNTLIYENTPIDFVYNRLTDFYLDKYPSIKKAFESGKVCISPNPHEYDLLANKKRLVDWSNTSKLQELIPDLNYRSACETVISRTAHIRDFKAEDLVKNKKRYFFKPATAFGGKGVYRGESIQRKILDEIMKQDYLVQDYHRPPEIEVDQNGMKQKFKYDLRFYVYMDTIQLVSARLYQGQVTNFRAPGSGICTVQLS